MRKSELSCLALLLVFATLTGAESLAAEELKVEADQGGVARWASETAASCGMDGATWQALDGACYYPIDLERAPGTIEIARWLPEKDIEKAWLVIKEKEYELQEIDIDDTFVHLSAENMERHQEEQGKIRAVLAERSGEPRFTLPLGAPVNPPVPEARDFGARRVYNGEPRSPHSGSDFSVGVGNPVLAVADGKVVLTGDHFFAGNSVYLYHGDGLVSVYFHLSEIAVEEGQEVSKGDTVAKVGETGRTTGPHLHLGFSWKGAWVDPVDLLGSAEDLPAVSGGGDAASAQGESAGQ